MVGKCGSNIARTGGPARDVLSRWKAASWSGVHVNMRRGLSKGRSGWAALEMSGENSASWFTRPINERRSVMFAGVGNSAMAHLLRVCCNGGSRQHKPTEPDGGCGQAELVRVQGDTAGATPGRDLMDSV